MLSLVGLAVLILGFILRFNPLLVVAAAGVSAGIAYGASIVDIISSVGKSFSNSRYMGFIWLSLPLICLLEKQGLRMAVKNFATKMRFAKAGKILASYLFIRQLSTAIGLSSLGGQAQMVRPILVPMIESVSSKEGNKLDDRARDNLRAKAASVDNVAAFFGECLFVGMPSILLIKSFLGNYGIYMDPIAIIVWGLPTAIVALIVHGYRMLLLDK
ncbi:MULTISPECIES: 5-oxoproline transporter, DUF969 family subunit [Serratia]|uniref:5-oxoproline transporter, DUF969 family subunit n=1 Tax=Serratia TaxID=613 RepID=UPI000C9B3910|nr:DUF969 family protein [Serratia marcescens]HED2348530.1 DUF969 domain-containing protein [Serratia marcescens]